MKPVLFLDFDGVLNSRRWFQIREHSEESYRSLDPAAVGLLNQIVVRTGAEVVISSTWRVLANDLASKMLRKRGFIGTVIGKTPELRGAPSGRRRGMEIQAFLDDWRRFMTLERFAILDDEADMAHLLPHLVQTTFQDGLQPSHVEQVVEMLAPGRSLSAVAAGISSSCRWHGPFTGEVTGCCIHDAHLQEGRTS